mgnify:CR=1 FL=1
MKAKGIILTIDIGPDGASLGKGHANDFVWTNTEKGILAILDAFNEISVKHGIDVSATWFIRSDKVIQDSFGSYSELFDKIGPVISGASASHELGWLPQLYTDGDISKTLSSEYCTSNLSDAYHALTAAGYGIQSSRMGDCYHNNHTMKALEDLGIRYDCSALPHRVKKEAGWYIDWELTGDKAYHPSRKDYRLAGEPSYGLLEIPLTMVDILADYEAKPLSRYINPCFKVDYLWQNLEGVIEKAEYLHCILHPDEIVPSQKNARHPLVSYSYKDTISNLTRIINTCEKSNKCVEFYSVSDFGNKLVSNGL